MSLLAGVAAQYPRDSLVWLPDGQPAVLARLVALGSYGRVSGVDEHGAPVTAEGYIQRARPVRGGLGGRHNAALVVVHLGEHPDGPSNAVVQAFPDDRVHIRWPPPDDMPPGALAPWLRLPVQHQILAARHLLGLDVEVVDGPINPLWTVEGCPHQVTGDVARWLFGGRYGTWDGRARPVFDAPHLDQAIAAGRVQPNGRPWPHTPHRPVPPPWFGTGQVPGIEARRRTVTAALAQALIYGMIAEAARQAAPTGDCAPSTGAQSTPVTSPRIWLLRPRAHFT